MHLANAPRRWDFSEGKTYFSLTIDFFLQAHRSAVTQPHWDLETLHFYFFQLIKLGIYNLCNKYDENNFVYYVTFDYVKCGTSSLKKMLIFHLLWESEWDGGGAVRRSRAEMPTSNWTSSLGIMEWIIQSTVIIMRMLLCLIYGKY